MRLDLIGMLPVVPTELNDGMAWRVYATPGPADEPGRAPLAGCRST
jgi:hypothetical protein